MTAIWYDLVNDAVQSNDSDTYRKALPTAGALHGLLIKVKATNGSTSGRNVTVLDVVDEIRLKSERKDPIFMLSSQEIEKWYECFLGAGLPAVYDEQADAVQEFVFPIWFGRQQYDHEKYFPLSRHAATEVEIDFSPSIAADGGFATGTTTIDIKALITPNEAGLPYSGTLTQRRLFTHTSVASGEKEFELPGRAKLRAVGIYVYEAGVADDTNVTKVLLRNTNDNQKVLEFGWDDLIHMNFSEFGGILERVITLFAQNNDTVKTRIGEILGVFMKARVAVDTTGDVLIVDVADAIAGDQLTIDSGSVDITAGSETITAYTTDHIIDCVVKGKFPSYFGIVPLWYPDDSGGYWDSANEGGLEAVITQANAGATVKISAQIEEVW